MSAHEVLATFRADAAAIVVGVALCTIALMLVAFAVSGRETRDVRLLMAGLFAAFYGGRIIVSSASFDVISSHPAWLPYLRSALEYLVPLPGTALFAVAFGERWRKLNFGTVIVFAVLAGVAIPYEIATRTPFALNSVVNAIVVVLMVIFALNIFLPGPEEKSDWGVIRYAALVFIAFVLNEHGRFISDRYGLTREPVGFLVLIGTIIMVVIRDRVRTQIRLGGIEGELATARRIQLSILPRNPTGMSGLEVASRYEPASEVAGDFFEFVRVDESRLGVLIADVSGHGVPAALVASMLKVAIASHVSLATRPAALLEAMNRLFVGKLDRQFISAAYAFVDATADSVVIGSAGHPPPLILHQGGAVEEVAAPGVVLGRFREAQFEERQQRFAPGDALVLYTDGITEARNVGEEMFGDDRLQAVVAGVDRSAAAAMATAVVDAVAAFAPGRMEDDVTLVVVRRTFSSAI